MAVEVMETNTRFGSIASLWPSPGRFRSTPINRHSQNPSACLKGTKRRHCAPCALFGGPSGAPRRSESVRRCERFLAYPGVLQQFVFQIEFGVRCPRVVRPGHDDIYNSRVEKRPKQCDGPHKSCHRCRQSTCTGTVGLASSRHRLVRTFVYSVGLRSAFIVCLRDSVANPIPGSAMLFGWFRSKGARDRSRLIKRIVSILKRGRDVF